MWYAGIDWGAVNAPRLRFMFRSADGLPALT